MRIAIDNKIKVVCFVHFHNDLISQITYLIKRQNKNQMDNSSSTYSDIMHTIYIQTVWIMCG